MFYDLLQEQIVSGELLNSKIGFSLLVYVHDFLSQIQNTDSERNEHLKQSFIKIQNLLHEQFSNKLVGDPFVLELISELQEGGSFDCKKDMEDEVTKRARESILSSIGDCFKEKFIDFYGIDINDVFECVSNYVNKLNNDPNALKSVKVKAQMAIDVIDTAKSKN